MQDYDFHPNYKFIIAGNIATPPSHKAIGPYATPHKPQGNSMRLYLFPCQDPLAYEGDLLTMETGQTGGSARTMPCTCPWGYREMWLGNSRILGWDRCGLWKLFEFGEYVPSL